MYYKRSTNPGVEYAGKIVREIMLPEQAAGKHELNVDVSAIPMGFYTVRMKTNAGISFARLQVMR